MFASINDYSLADGTLSGGEALTGLQIRMQRYFDVFIPVPEEFDSGALVVGITYKILHYEGGDDFTNVGGVNTGGTIFTATGTTPTNWSNGSILIVSVPIFLDRGKRRCEISFNVQRVQDTITDAEDFINIHEATIPHTGDVKLISSSSGIMLGPTVVALIVNGAVLQHELVRQIGKFTEHSYRIVGSPIFAPTPEGDFLVTEGGDRIVTEGGDGILVE